MASKALRDAMLEAERFLSRCAEVLSEEAATARENAERGQGEWPLHPSRTPHAAAKRASMDLTRALAKMRKPGAF